MNNTSSTGDKHDIPLESGMKSELMPATDDTITADEATNAAGVGLFQVKLVVLSGFVWMARGFEGVILTSASSLQACSWSLQHWHGALLSTLVVLFTILGCFLHGVWSDIYGRRTALSSSLIFLFVFGAVSAGLPTYTWFLIFRSAAGFAVGGLPQTLVLCCEYMPGKKRGRAIYVLSCFWALSVVIMLSVLYWTMELKENWRVFVAVGALPAFVAMILMRFFPESFRFLMVTNQYLPANEIMAEMAETNGGKVTSQLTPLPPKKRRKLLYDLLSKVFIKSTVLFWIMGFITAISYFGLTSMTPFLMNGGAVEFKAYNASAMDFWRDLFKPVPCVKHMTQNEFVFTIATTALDFPAFVIYLILVDLIDRTKLLCASYLLSCIFIFLLFVPTSKIMMHVTFTYCARTLLHGQFDLLLLMVAETFPTSHRGTAVGLEVGTFHVGAFLNSYIVQCLLQHSIMYAIIFYGSLLFLCAAMFFGLEHETRGRPLQDIIRRDDGTLH